MKNLKACSEIDRMKWYFLLLAPFIWITFFNVILAALTKMGNKL